MPAFLFLFNKLNGSKDKGDSDENRVEKRVVECF